MTSSARRSLPASFPASHRRASWLAALFVFVLLPSESHTMSDTSPATAPLHYRCSEAAAPKAQPKTPAKAGATGGLEADLCALFAAALTDAHPDRPLVPAPSKAPSEAEPEPLAELVVLIAQSSRLEARIDWYVNGMVHTGTSLGSLSAGGPLPEAKLRRFFAALVKASPPPAL